MNPSLLLIPDRYKASKLYSQIPDSGAGDLAFTRANDTATRVNSAGLIEKVRTNLLLQSNTFNTTWASGGPGATVTSGQTDPDGGSSAWLLAKLGQTGRIEQNLTMAANEQTFSIVAKKGTSNFLNATVFDGTTAHEVYFNLDTGAVGTQTNAVGSIVSLSGGWYRCFVTSTNASAAGTIQLYISDSNGAVTGATGNIFIYQSQFENGVATPYIPTTTAAVSVGPVADIPRIDYTGGGCGKLLLEPQRTNLVTFSEQFNNAAWAKGNTTITANAAVSPDGFINADAIVETATNAEHNIALAAAATTTTSVAQTISVFLKSGTQEFAMLRNFGGGDQLYFCVVVNLNTGTITKTQAGTNTSATASSITAYGNGWYRVTATCAFPSTTNIPILHLVNSANPTIGTFGQNSYLGNGTNSVFAWGFQLENASAYATSYIPTLGASVTRSADAASKTGISSLIGQTEGTILVDFVWTGATSSFGYISVENAGTNYRVRMLYIQSTNTFGFDYIQNNVSLGNIHTFAPVIGQRYRIAWAYKSGDSAIYINGTQSALDTDAITYTDLSSLNFDNPSAPLQQVMGGGYNQAILFPTRLSNADLASLTTL